MKEYIRSKVNKCNTLEDKKKLIIKIKKISNKIFDECDHQEITNTNKIEYTNQLKKMITPFGKLKFSTKEAVNELINFMESYEITYHSIEDSEYEYGARDKQISMTFGTNIGYTNTNSTGGDQGRDTYCIKSNITNQILIAHNCNNGCTTQFNDSRIKQEIKKIGFKHITVTDFICFFGLITESDCIENYD